MEEEKNKKSHKNLWIGLAIGLSSFVLGALIGGCTAQMGAEKPLNALTSVNNGYEKVYELNEPKRAMANEIYCYNDTGYPIWYNDGDNYLPTGLSILYPSDWFADHDDYLTFYLEVNGYLEMAVDGDWDWVVPLPTTTLDYEMVETGIYQLEFNYSATSTISIYYDFPKGSGDLTALNQNLQTIMRVAPQEHTEIERADLINAQIKTDNYKAKWSTSDLYSNNLAGFATSSKMGYNCTWASLAYPSIYVSPDVTLYQWENKTGYEFHYSKVTLTTTTTGALPTNEVINPWGYATFTATSEFVSIWCDYPFVLSNAGFSNGYYTSIYGNRAGSTMEGKYFLTMVQDSIAPNSPIKITMAGTEGEIAGESLSGAFALVGQAFAGIVPILQIKIFGEFTIGLLISIPLIFALIVMIFKLIKK